MALRYLMRKKGLPARAGDATMRLRHSVCASLALGLFALLPRTAPENGEIVLNRNGWKLPDTTKLVLEKVERMTLPGIPVEIHAEWWKLPEGSPYRIENFPNARSKHFDPGSPLIEELGRLIIFKTPKDEVLCHQYIRSLTGKYTGLSLGATFTFICDFDNDGTYEFQMGGGSEENDRILLVSIIRIKLGLSEETDLVRRIIGSALREMGNSKVEPYN